MAEDAVDPAAFYDCNAARFAADTMKADMSAVRARFLRHVPSGARILDAGCGVGRDALVFLELGYQVVAFDASVEMVRLARKRLSGQAEVLQARFEQIAWRREFDGIWACASLLHVRLDRFKPTAERLANSLRPGGTCYMSFKYGVGERDVGGRRFTDHTEETLEAALRKTGFRLAEVWVSEDVRPGRDDELWLNALAECPLKKGI